MLLSEISSQSSAGVIHQVNRYLLECYQCVINTRTPTGTLKQLDQNLTKTIREMREDGATPEHSDYARATMIQQALHSLLAQRALVESLSGPHSSVFDRVCATLYQSACDCVNVGDSIDHAMHKVMDAYRSSRYRFPDQQVEDRVYEMLCDTFDHRPFANTTLLDAEDFDLSDSLDHTELVQRIRQNLESAHSAVVELADSDQLDRHIEEVAAIYSDLPDTKLTSKLVSELSDQVLKRLGLNSGDHSEELPQTPLSQIKQLISVEPDDVQEVADAMLRRMRLLYPEVFDEYSAEDISDAVIVVAGFEAPAPDLSKDIVDPWVHSTIKDLERTASVQEKYSKRRKS